MSSAISNRDQSAEALKSLQRQQLALGMVNIYQNHQISKKLGEVSSAVKETNSILSSMQRTQLDEKRRQDLKDLEEKKLKLVKQAIFEIRQEVDIIKKEGASFPYKASKTISLLEQLEIHQVSPSLVDDFSEKKFIADIVSELQGMHRDLVNSRDEDERRFLSAFSSVSKSVKISPLRIKYPEGDLKKVEEELRAILDANEARKPCPKVSELTSVELKKVFEKDPDYILGKRGSLPFISGPLWLLFASAPFLEKDRSKINWYMYILVMIVMSVWVLAKIAIRRAGPSFSEKEKKSLVEHTGKLSKEIQSIAEKRLEISNANRRIKEINAEIVALRRRYSDVDSILGELALFNEQELITVSV